VVEVHEGVIDVLATAEQVEQGLRRSMPYLDYRKLPLPPTVSSGMVQDSFVDAFSEAADDDLLILTDMDIRIQRDLTEAEWKWAEAAIDSHSIGVYYNCGDGDTLAMEAQRIGLSQQWIERWVPVDLSDVPVRNCGVMVARASVYRQIRKVYGRYYEEFAASAHRSKCQFLLNFCWWRMGMNVVVLPSQWHQHGHARAADGSVLLPASSGAEFRQSVLFAGGEPVVFRHNFPE
jgi:hypothetical protein